MPIYEYRCTACGKQLEIMQKHSDEPLTVCPDCGGDMKKLISNTSFVLKGTGWYKTDYASGKAEKPEAPAKANDSGTTTATPEKTTEKKSEAA